MHLDFKKWLQVFLLNAGFSDIEFYYFLLVNHDTFIVLNKNHNSRCLSFSQSIAKSKNIITIASHSGNMTNQSVIMAQAVKNPPETEEMQVQPLGWEDPLEEEMATHSCILAWKIPRTEEPRGLQSRGSRRVGHDWALGGWRDKIITYDLGG